MSFEWMNVNHTANPGAGKAQVESAVREQAGLLRRLGYDVKYATRRCLENVHWQYDGSKAPLKDTENTILPILKPSSPWSLHLSSQRSGRGSHWR